MALTTAVDYLFDLTAAATISPLTGANINDAPVLDLAASAVTAAVNVLEDAGEQLAHNQITFEIPSHHDLEHINTLHKFNTLLQRIGNVAYDTAAAHGSESHSLGGVDSAGQRITTEQISKSAVLNLADLKGSTGIDSGFLERFFDGADMHTIINYLWIGVVTSLVILSVIFIVFSCYFYRKFREWKKCNKDIRNHLSNDMYTDGHLVLCDRLMGAHGQHTGMAGVDTAYYQVESPPCYTIATGLPTYDEALYHNQHYAYGMKLICPTVAAVHHHSTIAGYDSNSITTKWGKGDDSLNQVTRETMQKSSKHQQPKERQMKQKSKNAAATLKALSSSYETKYVHGLSGVGIATPLLNVPEEKLEVVTICLDDMTTASISRETTAATLNTQIANQPTDDVEICSAVTIA